MFLGYAGSFLACFFVDPCDGKRLEVAINTQVQRVVEMKES